MLVYCKSEQLKFRHSVMGVLAVLFPLLISILSVSVAPGFFEIDNMNWWYVTILPGYLVLVSANLVQKDKKLKNRAIWSLPVDMGKIWTAKIMIGIKYVAVASAVCLLITMAMSKVILPAYSNVSLVSFVLAGIIWVLTFSWQIPLWMMLEQKAGFVASVIIGMTANMVGSIFFAIESYWFVNPFAIPARLMCAVLNILPNGLPAEPGNMTYVEGITSNTVILPGIVIALVWFAVLLIVSRKWYEKQEVH